MKVVWNSQHALLGKICTLEKLKKVITEEREIKKNLKAVGFRFIVARNSQ